MPNWCSNALVTENDDFWKVVVDHVNANNIFEPFFTHFVPQPEELADIHRGSRIVDGVKVTHWREDADGNVIPVTPEEIREYVKNYGAADWYDWSVQEWGTKWDTEARFSGGQLNFETAWSPPEPFVAKLSGIFPGHDFVLAFAEGGMGFRGTATFRDGKKISENVINGNFWLDDPDPEYGEPPVTADCRSFLDEYGLGTGG